MKGKGKNSDWVLGSWNSSQEKTVMIDFSFVIVSTTVSTDFCVETLLSRHYQILAPDWSKLSVFQQSCDQ